ncbi:MAG: hypothetical protein KDD45_16080 [Bdellovibrionales bacterium]|nr:hypothetical protein [Bdellovibrionales bacterium]
MTKLFVLIISSLVFSIPSLAGSFSKNCPDKLSLTLSDFNLLPPSDKILLNPFHSASYKVASQLGPVVKSEYHIVSKTKQNLCVYSDSVNSAFLQKNNGRIEVAATIAQNVYLRIPLKSFSVNGVIAKDIVTAKQLLSANFYIDSDGGMTYKSETPVAYVESLELR